MDSKNKQQESRRENLWIWVRSRLEDRPDSEHEQALVRIGILTCLGLYLAASLTLQQTDTDVWLTGILILIVAFLGAIGIFTAILIRPEASPIRRILGICLDMSGLSVTLALLGDLFIPWYGVYLWITLGNGFRYGHRYLYLSASLSVIGFSLAILNNDFFSSHLGLSIGLLATLILVPAYAATLLRRLHMERQRAEAASRAKSDFLARMTHEVRTPLNGILATGDLLKSSPLGREEREYANAIYASSQVLLNLVNNVLDISKIEAGKLTQETTDFDLHALLHTMTDIFSSQAKAKGLRLTRKIDPNIPYQLRGDLLRLQQILINLIGNAIKFTEQGHVEIRCLRIPSKEQRVIIRFEIVDTGIGIPENKQEHIFKLFTQADESTTRRYGGSGLGTTIASQLVNLMGGHLKLDSTPSTGSRFWFDLGFESQPHALPIEDSESLCGCRVLRLSDKQATEISKLLEEWHIDSQSIMNLDQALDLLEQEAEDHTPFSVFIIDDFSALLELEPLKQNPTLQDTTILIAQAGERRSISAFQEQNEIHFLSSPLDKVQLFNALRAARTAISVQEAEEMLSTQVPYLATLQLQSLKLLVAEDNITNRMVIVRILERAGHQVTITSNGLEAVEALGSDSFDVVIVDMNMPYLSGIEVYQQHHAANQERPIAPFIMLTACATVETRQECKAAGIEYFLSKPIVSSQLLETIDKAYKKETMPLKEEVQAEEAPDESKQSPIINPAILKRIDSFGGDDHFLSTLCHNFLDNSTDMLQQMHTAMLDEDYLLYQEIAHSLAGSSACLGLKELADQAAMTSQLSVEQIANKGGSHLKALKETHQRATSALQEELSKQSYCKNA